MAILVNKLGRSVEVIVLKRSDYSWKVKPKGGGGVLLVERGDPTQKVFDSEFAVKDSQYWLKQNSRGIRK